MLLLLPAALAAPACHPGAVADGAGALAQVSVDMQPVLAAAAIAEACRLPTRIEEALANYGSVSPDQARLVDARAAEEIGLWVAACPAGPGVLAKAMSLRPPDARASVYEGCALDRLKMFDKAEFSAATGALVLSVMMADWLPRNADAKLARPLVRALAGIPVATDYAPTPMLPMLPMLERVPPPPDE